MITVTMEQVIEFGRNIDFFSNTNLPLKGAYKLNKIRKALEKDTDFHDTAKMIYDSIKLFNQDIKYTDGDIFHGTIDPYRRMSHFNRHW